MFWQVFAGQKHEVLTPPHRISQHAFESILKVVEQDRKKRSRRRPDLNDELASDSQSSVTQSDAERSGSFGRGLSHDQADLPQGSATMISDETTVSQNSLSDEEETGLMRGWVDFDRDLRLLQAWYKLDENHIPAEYRLVPVRCVNGNIFHFSLMLSFNFVETKMFHKIERMVTGIIDSIIQVCIDSVHVVSD